MLWKRLLCSLAVLTCAACIVRPVSAQAGGSDLPDLSGLAGAIESSTKDAPLAQPKPPAPGTMYHSGMAVPTVHPGEAAKGYVHQLRETFVRGKAPATAVNAMQQLEDGMPKMLSDFEAYMQKNSFAKRDMGVAYGVFFAENWKTATKQPLSDAAEANVVRTYSDYAASKYKAKFAAQSPAQKEKTYEVVLSGTMILSEFAQVYDKAGKTEMEASMRKGAKALFTKVIGVDPAKVYISLDGKISGSAPPPAGADTPGEAPLLDSPQMPTDPLPSETTPPTTDTSPLGAPSDKPTGPSGKAAPHGVAPSKIAGIYAQLTPQQGVGGFVGQVYVPVVAYKDGTYCEDFEVPPSELDIAASRRDHPASWSHWRRAGKNFQYQYDGQWKDIVWVGPLSGGSPSAKLSGTYSAASGGGDVALGGESSSLVQEKWTFSPDGHFQSSKRSSLMVGNAPVIKTQEVSGTYSLGNYAITLRAESGQTQRWSYARTADGLLFLHGSPYAMDKNKAAAN